MNLNYRTIFGLTLSLSSILGGVMGLAYFESQPTPNVQVYGSILSWGWIAVGVLQLAITGVEIATGLGRLLFFVVTVLLGCIPFTGIVAIALRLSGSGPVLTIGACWSIFFLAYVLAFAGVLKPRTSKC